MSGYLRFCFTGFALAGILSTIPASSAPLDDLLNITPRARAPTYPAQAECLARPGNSAPDGQHWVYRVDGRRKCWFLAEGIATVKKPVRSRIAKDPVASKRSPVVDARAELLPSRPAGQSQPPVPEFKVADASSEPGTSTTAPIQAVPDLHRRASQLTSEFSVPPQVDVEKLLAAASDAAAASMPPALPVGMRPRGGGDEGRDWAVTWLGLLLIVLGIGSVLSSSRALREAVMLRYWELTGLGAARGRANYGMSAFASRAVLR
ncbi:hypothetical protein JEY40_22495 [Bradyrhizobium japonicum]|uniref:hypothetical protein n=1 Tax=Bradyrhizobium japonicum TaxID=375 RepID=UPI00200BF3B8|nr:hypothetical protein [Bradyrhizobium japonicum]UQD68817.1 hypothetical protein JEY40_22495 [Bradyrhizobium japonicum]